MGNRSPRHQQQAAPPRVGQTLQRLRIERKLTLDQLSRVAGVSKSMLSEIERDKANPTIAVAWRLANALGLGLDQLLDSGTQRKVGVRVLRTHETPTLTGADQNHVLKILGPMELAGRFEWYDLVLTPGGALTSEGHDPGTQEHLTVLTGTVEVTSADMTSKVATGETARYPADRKHSIRNVGRTNARGFLVVIHG